MQPQDHPSQLKKKLSDLLNRIAFYERFEHLVTLALTFIISLIVVVALFRLTWDVIELLLLKTFDPLDHNVFQTITVRWRANSISILGRHWGG